MKDTAKNFLNFIVFDVLETIVIALAIFVVIYVFLVSPHIVVGQSMDVTFANGEFLLINEIGYRVSTPQKGDVIVFKFDAEHDYIKRIIAMGGDKVLLKDGSVYVNDEKLNESIYVTPGNLTYGLDFLSNNQEITVPKGKYFVLGDNREASSDSREWGFVDRDKIEGKAWLVYWPVKSFRLMSDVRYKDTNHTLVAYKK